MFATTLTAGLLALPLALTLPTDPSLQKRATSGRMVNYVQTFQTYPDKSSALSIRPFYDEHTSVTDIYLAAVHVNGDTPGDINLNDNAINSSYWDQVWTDAAYLQQNGIRVMAMIGGAAKGSYQTLCSGTGGNIINDDFYIPLRQTLAYHNLDGVDLDIEESVSLSCALALLQRFDADFGPDFILTMAPVASGLMKSAGQEGPNLSGFSYFSLDEQATSSSRPNGKLVNWYNAQFYNGWGDASTPSDYQRVISSGFAPERVNMGVLDGKSDGGSGFVALSTLKNTWCQLEEQEMTALSPDTTTFGGASGWEYWDAGANDNLQYPYQWTQMSAEQTVTSRCAAGSGSSIVPGVSNPLVPDPNGTQYLIDKYGINVFQAVYALNVTDFDLDAADALAATLTPLTGGFWDLIQFALGLVSGILG